MKVLSSVQDTLLAMVRGLKVPAFYLLLLLAAPVWLLAYQYKVPYSVDLGGVTDDAYLFDFNGKEHNTDLNYRWTRGVSTLLLPGIGDEPVKVSLTTVGYRPTGTPPMIKVEARGQTFQLQTHSEPHTDTFLLERGDPSEADFRLVLSSPVFSPTGDQRELGVIVDRIIVEPASYGLRPFVLPPLGAILAFLFTGAAVYLGSIVTLRSRPVALAACAAVSLVIAFLILYARPELGLLAGSLPSLICWGLLLAFVGRLLLDGFINSGLPSARFTIGVGSAMFAVAFLLRFGGLTYPQFMSSDLGLHIHNLQAVMHGEWLFTEQLPDGTPQPYAPALYVLLAPIAQLLGSSDYTAGLLLKWSGALLDSAVCLGLAWAGWRLWAGRAGALASVVYAVSPAPFDLFSAGNYTNLFGQSVLNLTLLLAMVYMARNRRNHAIRWPLFLATGFALTMLGHYGMMLAALTIMAFFGVWALWRLTRRRRENRAWMVLGAFTLGLVGSFALYYGHFVEPIVRQLTGVLRRALGEHQSTSTAQQSPVTQPAREAMYSRLGRKLDVLSGTLILLSGLSGMSLGIRMSRPARALLLSWLLGSLFFFLLDQTLGDSIRWYYLGAAAVALVAGRYLALLMARQRAGRLLAWLCVSTMLLHLLYFWVGDLIFSRYHV